MVSRPIQIRHELRKRIDEFLHELNQCTVPCGGVHTCFFNLSNNLSRNQKKVLFMNSHQIRLVIWDESNSSLSVDGPLLRWVHPWAGASVSHSTSFKSGRFVITESSGFIVCKTAWIDLYTCQILMPNAFNLISSPSTAEFFYFHTLEQ